jgi:DNA-binding NarL/FixJ family response regulator
MPKLMSENSRPILTVLVSRPGIMQQSLRSLLAACPPIAVIATAGDGLTAVQQIMQHQPRLLIIDSNLLDEEIAGLLKVAKAKQPPIGCVAFVKAAHQAAQLLASGADAVAHRDWSTQELHAALAKLVRSLEEAEV